MTTDKDGTTYAPHIACYEFKPSMETLQGLVEELAADATFGMLGLKVNEDYQISVADRNDPELKEWFTEVGVPYEF